MRLVSLQKGSHSPVYGKRRVPRARADREVRRIVVTAATSSTNGSGMLGLMSPAMRLRRSRPVPGTDAHTAKASSASRINASAVTINAPTNAMSVSYTHLTLPTN